MFTLDNYMFNTNIGTMKIYIKWNNRLYYNDYFLIIHLLLFIVKYHIKLEKYYFIFLSYIIYIWGIFK